MVVDNTQLKSNISNDKLMIQEMLESHVETDVYPFATFSLFSRFVEFEQFVISAYIQYALGEQSSSGFSPYIEIDFKNEENLKMFHKPIDKFVTIKTIKDLYTVMFGDGITVKNPFSSLFHNNYPDYEKLESIRNLIAHKSPEAYEKFYNKCNNRAPCTLDDYLFRYNGAFANYNMWLKFIENMSDLIISPI